MDVNNRSTKKLEGTDTMHNRLSRSEKNLFQSITPGLPLKSVPAYASTMVLKVKEECSIPHDSGSNADDDMHYYTVSIPDFYFKALRQFARVNNTTSSSVLEHIIKGYIEYYILSPD